MGKIEDILEQVRQTKALMISNIDALITRGDKLEALKDKTDNLEDQAKLFAEQAQDLNHQAKNRYLSLTFIFIGLSLGAVYTIINGYGLPIIIASMVIGGVLGFAVNWARNFVVESLSPARLLSPIIPDETGLGLNAKPTHGQALLNQFSGTSSGARFIVEPQKEDSQEDAYRNRRRMI